MADSRKTEQPTQKKLRDAREKGEIAKSAEVSSVVQLLGFMIAMYFLSRGILGTMVKGFYASYDAVANVKTFSEANAFNMMAGSVFQMLSALGPFFMVLTAIALISGALQSGFTFSGKALDWDIKKINPMNGFGRLFSTRSWVELFKALFKVGVVFTLLYNMFMTEKDRFLQLSGMDVFTIANYAGYVFMEIVKKTVIFLLAMAVIDFVWQRHYFMNNMKMTKEEVKDEIKQTEGDLRTKAMIRAWHKKKIKNRMMANIRKATFVAVNPTHYAVALKYERGMKAPKLLAKGADLIAKRIREEAKLWNVPVVANPELTRAIFFSTEVNKFIPAKLFKAVAKILVFLYRMEREKKNGR
jgi:flagellar biosynthetic protein FlhB